MLRLVLLLFALFLFLTVLRGLRIFFMAVFRPSGPGAGGPPGEAKEGEMVRDPVCGTWIDRRLALSGRRDGQTVVVCSQKCLETLEASR